MKATTSSILAMTNLLLILLLLVGCAPTHLNNVKTQELSQPVLTSEQNTILKELLIDNFLDINQIKEGVIEEKISVYENVANFNEYNEKLIKTKILHYDVKGRLIKIQDDEHFSYFKYDSVNNIIERIDKKSEFNLYTKSINTYVKKYLFDYDTNNNLIKKVAYTESGLWGTSFYEYDRNKNLIMIKNIYSDENPMNISYDIIGDGQADTEQGLSKIKFIYEKNKFIRLEWYSNLGARLFEHPNYQRSISFDANKNIYVENNILEEKYHYNPYSFNEYTKTFIFDDNSNLKEMIYIPKRELKRVDSFYNRNEYDYNEKGHLIEHRVFVKQMDTEILFKRIIHEYKYD